MTIYVDEPRKHPNWRWASCHMMTDSDDLAELHEMAADIGCKREWFQDDSSHPHYDLSASRRARAIKLGAVPVSSKELVMRCSLFYKRGKEGNSEPR